MGVVEGTGIEVWMNNRTIEILRSTICMISMEDPCQPYLEGTNVNNPDSQSEA